ncbi:hypothetical protein [Modestobacter versicolor]|uniref:hypothetical protein n=1 Tax=Modestobacter versicolor TaxID=429133 RepID=UPI0034DFCBCD
MTTPLSDVPVRSAADLTRRWHTVLAPPVFGGRSLWLAWFDRDGRMLPVVVPVDELPRLPDHETLRGLLSLHDAVTEQTDCADGHLAIALCRPGTGVLTADDDEWAEALREDLDDGIDGTWSLHLAAGGSVLPVVAPPSWAWRR